MVGGAGFVNTAVAIVMLPVPDADTTVPAASEAALVTILFEILERALDVYKWVVIIAIVLSNLVSFGVVDRRNRFVWTVGDFLYRITEPALRPIRRMLPNFGGIDLSPIVLFALIWVAQALLVRVYAAIEYGNTRGLLL